MELILGANTGGRLRDGGEVVVKTRHNVPAKVWEKIILLTAFERDSEKKGLHGVLSVSRNAGNNACYGRSDAKKCGLKSRRAISSVCDCFSSPKAHPLSTTSR